MKEQKGMILLILLALAPACQAWTWGGAIAGGVGDVGGAIIAPIVIPAAFGGIEFTALGVAARPNATTIMPVAAGYMHAGGMDSQLQAWLLDYLLLL